MAFISSLLVAQAVNVIFQNGCRHLQSFPELQKKLDQKVIWRANGIIRWLAGGVELQNYSHHDFGRG